jgi:hypothetical protein
MGAYDFSKDLPAGKRGELMVRQWLEDAGARFVESCNDKRFDLKVLWERPQHQTYEVKTDSYAYNTGNLFVEFKSRGKDSGLEVTEADWWVQVQPGFREMWCIRPDSLKLLIERNKAKIHSTSYGGDANSGTCGHLLDRETFREKFKVIVLGEKYLNIVKGKGTGAADERPREAGE